MAKKKHNTYITYIQYIYIVRVKISTKAIGLHHCYKNIQNSYISYYMIYIKYHTKDNDS